MKVIYWTLLLSVTIYEQQKWVIEHLNTLLCIQTWKKYPCSSDPKFAYFKCPSKRVETMEYKHRLKQYCTFYI